MSLSVARNDLLLRAQESDPWDVVVIGGGATGLGAGLDAASRGYRTLLVDRGDFASGTSSRSTKLVHGGVRYLERGDVGLVFSALKERALLLRNAPHLVTELPLVVPAYRWWERFYFGVGLKVYDVLAGRKNLQRSRILSRHETLQRISTLNDDGLRGGVLYYDGQFDDARLALCLARSMMDAGGVALNYVEAKELTFFNRAVSGVVLKDRLSGEEWRVRSRVVINATGPFADELRMADDSKVNPLVVVSQGVHIVVSRAFLPGETAILVPKTPDGRVIFAIPWQGYVLIGTTDERKDHPEYEPMPTEEEIDYLLEHAGNYLTRPLDRGDVLSVWAGLRALALAGGAGKTSELSRDHAISVSTSGLVSVVGGKWTTYRKMGEDTIDRARSVAGLPRKTSKTEKMRLRGWSRRTDLEAPWNLYGEDAETLRELEKADPRLASVLDPALPVRASQVVFACRYEMARRVEDVLSRRTRALFLDARAAIRACEDVARLMAEELGEGEAWQDKEVEAFRALAAAYVVSDR